MRGEDVTSIKSLTSSGSSYCPESLCVLPLGMAADLSEIRYAGCTGMDVRVTGGNREMTTPVRMALWRGARMD